MLTRGINKLAISKSSIPLLSLSSGQQIISQRNFFDYLKIANEVDNGKNLEQIKEEKTKQKQERRFKNSIGILLIGLKSIFLRMVVN